MNATPQIRQRKDPETDKVYRCRVLSTGHEVDVRSGKRLAALDMMLAHLASIGQPLQEGEEVRVWRIESDGTPATAPSTLTLRARTYYVWEGPRGGAA